MVLILLKNLFLYKGTSSSGILVTSKQGASYNNGIRYQYTICMERDQSYYIEYHDSGCNGWDSGSSVQLLNGQNVVFEGRLESGESGSDLLTTASIILSTPQTLWKYTDFPQFNTEWTKSSFNDNSWSTASSGDYSVRAITTRYYRFSGTMENRDSITTLYSIINNRYGFVLYIQGSGLVTPTTPATLYDGTCYVRVQPTSLYCLNQVHLCWPMKFIFQKELAMLMIHLLVMLMLVIQAMKEMMVIIE